MNTNAMFVIVFACLCGFACAGGYPGPAYSPLPGYYSAPAYYPRPSYYPATYPSAYPAAYPEYREAGASGLTNVVGARASAAKIDAVNWDALNRYGVEIGVPLLAKKFGGLTNLYASSLPEATLVGQIDPVFQKGYYGKVKYHTGSALAATAL